jgi:hypothetical protein
MGVGSLRPCSQTLMMSMLIFLTIGTFSPPPPPTSNLPHARRALLWVECPAMLLGAAYSVYGWGGVAFLLGQAAGSVVMLETVNYIEHYGLQRRQLPGGR